ncbi:hypothetical protein chiPu_0016870 [Chiloscyllium punctatum]|uniref:Claudin n=1 Tax=Chiloscyllium punctatum TaxID=137246 RepID=A0A401T6S3_CHIPU|nr:hypothetical protein [Chiloscyllium punctatum]
MGHHGSRVALQLVGLVLGTVGWIGSAIATGLIQWRVWRVSSPEITSGVAWVGIWRVCLYSRPLATPPFQGMSCRRLGALDSFVPSEIGVGQGMMLAAVVLGALGKVATVYGLWDAYIGAVFSEGVSHCGVSVGSQTAAVSHCLLEGRLAFLWRLYRLTTTLPTHRPQPDPELLTQS